jgi:hypothetical protein
MHDLPPGALFIPADDPTHNQGPIGGHYIHLFGPFAAGHIYEGHRHYIPHLFDLVRGAATIYWAHIDGRHGILVVQAPNCVNVRADAWHTVITRMNDTRWRCLFSEKEADGQADWHSEKPVTDEDRQCMSLIQRMRSGELVPALVTTFGP